jgi:hypothetical protein
VLVNYFTKKLAKAKMKLNHYKQLLENFKKAPVVAKQKFKVGDKVRIKDGWSNSYLYVPSLAKYVGLEGEVRIFSYSTGNCKIRTALDGHALDSSLYNFPPEALELVL